MVVIGCEIHFDMHRSKTQKKMLGGGGADFSWMALAPSDRLLIGIFVSSHDILLLSFNTSLHWLSTKQSWLGDQQVPRLELYKASLEREGKIMHC